MILLRDKWVTSTNVPHICGVEEGWWLRVDSDTRVGTERRLDPGDGGGAQPSMDLPFSSPVLGDYPLQIWESI